MNTTSARIRPNTGEADDDPSDGDWLDRAHQARVSGVAKHDLAEDRKASAEVEMGLLTEEEQELLAERKALGGDEHLAAIARSRWLPHQPALQRGARIVLSFDGALWSALSASIIWQLMRFYNA